MSQASLRRAPDVSPSLAYATMFTMDAATLRARFSGRDRIRLPAVVGAVCASRVLGYGAGIAGVLISGRVTGWQSVDTTGLSTSFGATGNVLVSPLLRWDAVGYLNIAHHGYTQVRETVLFPGYPLAIAALGTVIRSYLIAGLLISLLGFGIGTWLLHKLAVRELGRPAADGAVLLMAFAPVSFFFTALYTESLFLALSVGAVYAARRERWWQAGLLAAAASVTRVTGILLLVPIALWQLSRYRRLNHQMAWLLLPPAALLGFLAYMQANGYGWLAPFRNQRTAHHFGGPWTTVFAAVKAAGHGLSATLSGTRPVAPSLGGPLSSSFDSLILLVVLALAVAALAVVFWRLPLAYGLYGLLALLVSIASQTKVQPLLGLDRYTLSMFPLWLGAGAWAVERRVLKPLVVLGGVLMAFYSYEFARWAFVA